MPKAPDLKVRQISQRFGTCDVYAVKFGAKLKFTFEKEVPLSECLIDGHFILTDSEIVELRRKYEEARACYMSRKCK